MLEDTFANRLKKALEYNNMKPIDLSRKTNINKSLISSYLSGVCKAKQDKLDLISEALDVSEAWLMGYDVNMERDLIENIDIDNAEILKVQSNVAKIPILGKVPAGTPIEAIEDILGYEEIPYDWLKSGNKYFALKVNGNSMYPDYKTGDIIIIKQQSDCESGDDCIVMVNGNDATFKRVIKHENNIILKPLNNEYEPYSFSEIEIINKPVKIIGVAIEVRRKLKK